MSVVANFSVALFIVKLFGLTLLAGCQESDVVSSIYIGAGVNGTASIKADNDIVVLGGLFSVFGNSGINPRSVQRMEAVALATQKINDNSSLLPGVTLAFELRATRGQVNRALEESLRYVSSRSLRIGFDNGTVLGISGVLGAGFSSVSTSVARLLRLFRIAQVSYASTADVLSDKSVFEYFLRTVPPDSFQAQALADIVTHFNWSYVVAMHTMDVYGMGGITAFISELESRNVTQPCIATTSSIELPTDSTQAADFDNAVERLNQEWIRNATVVVLFAQRNTAIGLLNAVKRRQESDPDFAVKNITWVGSDAWGNNIPSDLYGVVQGSLSVTQLSFSNAEFEQHFFSLNPLTHTANPWFNEYWELVFNCSIDGRPGYKQCNLTDQSLSLASTGLMSRIVTPAMDAVNAFAHAMHSIQQDRCGGGPGLCKEILDTRSGGVAIQGDLVLNYLRNVSFSPGASAEVVSFNANGDPKGTSYIVNNLQQNTNGSFSFKAVGIWDGARSEPLEINEEIQWSHNQGNVVPQSVCSLPCGDGEYPQSIAGQSECCWICRSCIGTRQVSTGLVCQECELGYKPNERRTQCVFIPISFLTWTHGWSIVTLILTCVGILATTAVVIVFIIYNKHQIIKASSRELSAVLLSGIMLCYFLPFFFIAKPSPGICAIRRFSVGFCFSLCYSALLIKTNRIHRIFNRKITTLEPPPLIGPISQLLFTGVLVAIQIIIASVWLIIDKPSITFSYTDFSTELKCGESTQIGLFISLGYNFVLLVITTYFAVRTRNVPQNFNEAKFISFTMYALCVLWLAFIPVYIAAAATLGVIYQTGSLVLAIILNASVTLCFLFAPKIYFLFSMMRKKQEESTYKSDTFSTYYKDVRSVESRSSLPQIQDNLISVKNSSIGKVHASTQTD